MRPIIGISCSQKNGSDVSLRREYVNAIVNNGGLPVLIPVNQEVEILMETMNVCHGLLLTGGGDVDPEFYGGNKNSELIKNVDPARDSFEISLVKITLNQKKPILAICRGMQILNTALGGDLYQDLSLEVPGALNHQLEESLDNFHPVKVNKNTYLRKFLNEETIVNSNHHQAVKKIGNNLIVAAVSYDGVVEAVQVTNDLWVVGVQWHPERLDDGKIIPNLFSEFIDRASKFMNDIAGEDGN